MISTHQGMYNIEVAGALVEPVQRLIVVNPHIHPKAPSLKSRDRDPGIEQSGKGITKTGGLCCELQGFGFRVYRVWGLRFRV